MIIMQNLKIILVLAIALFFISGCADNRNLNTIVQEENLTSLVYLAPITEGLTGSEVCYERDMSCISLSTTQVVDQESLFYGFITPNCEAQVVRESRCVTSHNTEFALKGVDYVKSPNAESSEYFNVDYLCLRNEKGKQGIYEFAYCVKK
ncbi:MAG: hypothetical protein ABIH20_01425 [Candidatus Diapherotrites archaeon]